MDEERLKTLKEIGNMVKENEDKLTDIRKRDWMTMDNRFAKALNLFIELEDILTDLDDYQMETGQYYTDFEELSNQLSHTREHFTKYIDSHPELLTMDDEIEEVLTNNR